MDVALRSINQTHLLSPDLNSPYKVCIENTPQSPNHDVSQPTAHSVMGKVVDTQSQTHKREVASLPHQAHEQHGHDEVGWVRKPGFVLIQTARNKYFQAPNKRGGQHLHST